MASLTSTETLLVLNNGNSMGRSGFTHKKSGDKVIVTSNNKSMSFNLDYRTDTVDEESFESAQDLFDKISELFIKGGGDGDGVTWDDVQDKPLKTLDTPLADAEGLVPVYTQDGQLPVGMPEFPENAVPLALLDDRAPDLTEGDFLVGGASGNEGRKILPSDILSSSAGNVVPVRTSASNNVWAPGYSVQTAPINSSITLRTSTGQGRFNPAINNDEAVVLSQFQGIINDELTDTETSITLNGLYPSIAVGSVVVSEVALTEYRKIEPTVWSKKTIEII